MKNPYLGVGRHAGALRAGRGLLGQRQAVRTAQGAAAAHEGAAGRVLHRFQAQLLAPVAPVRQLARGRGLPRAQSSCKRHFK